MKTRQKALPTSVSALTMRTQLGQMLRRVKGSKERFLIGRNGQPQAVLMGLDDYIDAVAPAPDWLKNSWKISKKNGNDMMSMREIDAIIQETRAEADKKKSRLRSR